MAALLGASLALGQHVKPAAPSSKVNALVYAELAKAPDKARAKRNPMEHDPDAVAAGQNLFEQHCSECHGNAGYGTEKAPSLRAEEVQGAAPGAIFWILTNGVVRRGMPVWSKLPEPQRWQLVSFIRSLGAVPKTPEGSRIRRACPGGSHRLWTHATNLGAGQPGVGACVARRQTVDPRREFPE
jgi:mono/diheme cytochrome c family protein